MDPQKSPELTVETLLALRKEEDAVRMITERLRVKEMGPADHIRTKHEVKAFVDSGDTTAASTLLRRVNERHTASQTITKRISQQHGQRLTE